MNNDPIYSVRKNNIASLQADKSEALMKKNDSTESITLIRTHLEAVSCSAPLEQHYDASPAFTLQRLLRYSTIGTGYCDR